MPAAARRRRRSQRRHSASRPRGHRDPGGSVAGGDGCAGQAVPLGSEQDREPGFGAERRIIDRHRILPQCEGNGGENPFRAAAQGRGRASPPPVPPAGSRAPERRCPCSPAPARRQSGSQQEGVSNTASICSAAAERKIAPTLVESTIFSSTATRRAPAQSTCGDLQGGAAHRAEHPPAGQGVAGQLGEQRAGTGIDRNVAAPPQPMRLRGRQACSPPSERRAVRSWPREHGRSPSALGDEDPHFGSRRLRSCASVSRANGASCGMPRS